MGERRRRLFDFFGGRQRSGAFPQDVPPDRHPLGNGSNRSSVGAAGIRLPTLYGFIILNGGLCLSGSELAVQPFPGGARWRWEPGT